MKPAIQRLPLRILEDQGAGGVRVHPPEHGQVIDPPGHHQIDGQTVLQAGDEAQLPLLYLAAGLEGAIKHLDAPARAIPAHPLLGLGQGGGGHIGQQ